MWNALVLGADAAMLLGFRVGRSLLTPDGWWRWWGRGG